ncbi:MAG: hypothetical protein SFZ03_02700 [Candidatus Melainabacteria bacterium]|nr:hypothetical protein [Candidatus Melainabacteria bacterium]
MTDVPQISSKLYIRSEVLAVMGVLTSVETPSRHDRAKQFRRLREIADREAVLLILVKELQRAKKPSDIQAVAEILMELGTIAHLQTPLWELIRNPNTTDEVKDAANLILRHLGDETDPDLYLEYLDDPLGLINRETERMLEVSSQNPEALIDFIDFICSLPEPEQIHLIESLQNDYRPDYLMNIYIPLIQAEPPTEVRQRLIRSLGKSGLTPAGMFLADWLAALQGSYVAASPDLIRAIQRALSEIRLSGALREEAVEAFQEQSVRHPLVQQTVLFDCYATLPDGVGNQGMVVSRQWSNGDITMMSLALNDLHGIIDCFGFYQLAQEDFERILQKFHEGNTKIRVPVSYCRNKIQWAEKMSRNNGSRIPYEYSCWKVLLEDVSLEPMDLMETVQPWATEAGMVLGANLYQHPDFETWFLEPGDHPEVTELLGQVSAMLEAAVAHPPESDAVFFDLLDTLSHQVTRALVNSGWKALLIPRLTEAAYLLHCQEIHSFSQLAASAAVQLRQEVDNQKLVETPGFLQQYGRRCVEEELLRVKEQLNLPSELRELVGRLLARWAV